MLLYHIFFMYPEESDLKFSYAFISFDHEISTDNDITRIKEDLEKISGDKKPVIISLSLVSSTFKE